MGKLTFGVLFYLEISFWGTVCPPVQNDGVLFVRVCKSMGYCLSACANRRGTICPRVQKWWGTLCPGYYSSGTRFHMILHGGGHLFPMFPGQYLHFVKWNSQRSTKSPLIIRNIIYSKKICLFDNYLRVLYYIRNNVTLRTHCCHSCYLKAFECTDPKIVL